MEVHTMSDFVDAVERGLEHVSVGYLPYADCGDCPEEQNEDVGDEGFFSWQSCDCCGSHLGGDRFAAHGIDSGGNGIHLDICVDCLVYIANGDEPEYISVARDGTIGD
jgi:hypothetical protein